MTTWGDWVVAPAHVRQTLAPWTGPSRTHGRTVTGHAHLSGAVRLLISRRTYGEATGGCGSATG
jgi:hypothetical protein